MVDLQIQLPEHFLDEETKCDFLINKSAKELWAVLLDLLFEFDRVCKKHNLKYWADSGTLLGAMRHQGFIPWDDDIDVVMLREDYDKLCTYASEFKHPYFFQTEETDPLSYRSHGQLRNSNTTGILNMEYGINLPFNQGIFIDIFPLDFIPDDEKQCQKFLNRINSTSHIFQQIRGLTTHYKPQNGIKGLLRSVAHFLLKPIGKNLLRKLYYKRERMISSCKGTKRIMKLYFYPTRVTPIMNYSYYEKSIMVPFEFMTIPVPAEYDAVLKNFFGEWHICKKAPSTHGGFVFDTNLNYIEYMLKYYNNLN